MKRFTRKQKLSPEQAAKYKKIRQLIAVEFPKLIVKHHKRRKQK